MIYKDEIYTFICVGNFAASIQLLCIIDHSDQ